MKSIILATSVSLCILAACSSNTYYPDSSPDAGSKEKVDAPAPPVWSPPTTVEDAGSSSPTTCDSENDSIFCSRFNKECGGFTQLDNCKDLRIAECGNCNSGYACDNGSCKAIPANCVAESDRQFCSRNNYNCGTHTTSDNCGSQRTVDSCGSLRCLGSYSSIQIAGGVPAEIAGNGTAMHVEAWFKPQAGYVQPDYTSNILNLGYQFGITVRSGLVYLNIRGTTYGGLSVQDGPNDYWTFVFAGYANGSYYLGKIVNDIVTRVAVAAPAPTYAWDVLTAGNGSYIADGFIGQINQVRIWSKARTDADMLPSHHDCLANQPGLVRQWCMREGTGTTIADSVTKLPSLLNGVVWDTGSCF